MTTRLLRLQKTSLTASFDLPTYERSRGRRLEYGLTTSIGHVDSAEWPVSLTVRYTASAADADGSSQGSITVVAVEIRYRLLFDHAVGDDRESTYGVNREVWPYCRQDLIDVLRDFPVAVGQLPWSMPELA